MDAGNGILIIESIGVGENKLRREASQGETQCNINT